MESPLLYMPTSCYAPCPSLTPASCLSVWSSKAVELSPDTSEFWLNRGLAYESIADTLFVAKPADATQVRQAKVA